MIGTVCTAFKYYDSAKRRMAFKGRPVLVIGKADDSDYVVLPISRVTKRDYNKIIDLVEEFQKNLINNARE
ncbi:MAG: hypothetical protein UFJ18_01115 [Blautia sp.]|nr:hypothetical protein [Blautia sp.]